jgi:hypothetical protein
MVRKIIQWVPIDGTRWRNEFVNDHEKHGVGVDHGAAPMANTINGETRQIEEGALVPESVRSESEPWAAFYAAGEIIRELRKAHKNKQVSLPSTEDDMRKAA